MYEHNLRSPQAIKECFLKAQPDDAVITAPVSPPVCSPKTKQEGKNKEILRQRADKAELADENYKYYLEHCRLEYSRQVLLHQLNMAQKEQKDVKARYAMIKVSHRSNSHDHMLDTRPLTIHNLLTGQRRRAWRVAWHAVQHPRHLWPQEELSQEGDRDKATVHMPSGRLQQRLRVGIYRNITRNNEFTLPSINSSCWSSNQPILTCLRT